MSAKLSFHDLTFTKFEIRIYRNSNLRFQSISLRAINYFDWLMTEIRFSHFKVTLMELVRTVKEMNIHEKLSKGMNIQKQLSNYFDNCHLQLVKIILILAWVKKSKFAKFNPILKKRDQSKVFQSFQSHSIESYPAQNNCFSILTLNGTWTVLVKIILDIITDNITCITDESFWWVIGLNGMILSWVN